MMIKNRIVSIQKSLAPPLFEGDIDKSRTARLLNTILLATLTVTLVYTAFSFLVTPREIGGVVLALVVVTLLLTLFLLVWLRRGQVRQVAVFLCVGLWLVVTAATLWFGGIGSPSFGGYFILVLLAGLVLGRWAALQFAGLSVLSLLGILFAELNHWLPAVTVDSTLRWGAQTLYLVFIALLLEFAIRQVNDALTSARRSEARYRLLMDQAADGIFLADAQTKFIEVNAAACQMLGYPRSELLGRSIADLITETDLAAHPWRLQELYDKQTLLIERQLRRKDGSVFFAEINARALADGNTQSIVRDITARKQSEESLRQSRERLRMVIDSAPIIVYGLDREGVFTLSEGKGLAGLGLKPGQAVGLSVYDLFSDIPQLRGLLQQVLNGEVVNTTVEARGLVFDALYAPLYDQTGQVVGITGVAADVTERRRAEETEAHFARILDVTAEAVIAVDESQRIILFNKSAERIFGYLAKDILNQPLDILLPAQFRAAHQHHFKQFVQSSEVARGMSSRQPLMGLRKDGTQFPMEASLSKFTWGEQTTLTVFIHDITERQDAEQALRQSEENYRLLVEHSPDIVFVQENQKIAYINPAGVQLLGASSPNEIIGKSVFEIVHPNHHPGVEANARRLLQSQSIVRNEEQWIRLNRQLIDVDVTAVPLTFGSKPAALIIARDITERKRAQQDLMEAERLRLEVQKDRELLSFKERFMSAVSHEFRTPLAVIVSSKELLAQYYDRLTPDRRQQHLQKIGEQTDQMTEMLDDLLTISKAQAGLLKFAPVALEVVAFCRNLLDQIQQVDSDRHTFSFSVTGSFDDAHMDEKLLRHIVTNLLTNAAKYATNGGGIEFTLSRDADTLLLRVRDDGIGIPPESQPHLFEPFYRAANARTIPGTGLGLAIVKSSVEAHHGTITFSSELGKGTTFEVQLPLFHS